MNGRFVRIKASASQDFEAYQTSKSKGPGLILLAEMFNANENIRGVADEWAERGFFCISPDLYWRARPRAYFNYDDPDRAVARELYQGLDRDLAADDVECCASYVRNHPQCNGRVLAMGYCLGGELALLAALRGDVESASVYYGTNLMRHVDKLNELSVPTLMHFAELDEHVPLSVANAYEAAARRVECLRVHVYPQAEHAFARPNRPQYNAQATTLADSRTADWFR